jgi:hypothetical protein
MESGEFVCVETFGEVVRFEKGKYLIKTSNGVITADKDEVYPLPTPQDLATAVCCPTCESEMTHESNDKGKDVWFCRVCNNIWQAINKGEI